MDNSPILSPQKSTIVTFPVPKWQAVATERGRWGTGPSLAPNELRLTHNARVQHYFLEEAFRENYQDPDSGRRTRATGRADLGPAASDQGRRAAFAFRHDGDQRDHAEGHRTHADRRAE